jgi:hypothetical protein
MTHEQLIDAALSRFDGNNFEGLSEIDQLLITIWGLEADVNNGGFDQYYFNSYGDFALKAPAALRKIGATTMASIVEAANAIFGANGPPADRNSRQDALFAISDAKDGAWEALDRQFWAYPDDIAVLLQNYLQHAPVA